MIIGTYKYNRRRYKDSLKRVINIKQQREEPAMKIDAELLFRPCE